MATWPTIIDDDGSLTTGTVGDKALFDQIKAYIDGVAGALTTYTPGWGSAAGANPAIGNGAITGHYAVMGGIVWVNIRLQIGSTTTLGGGGWLFQLPILNAGWGVQLTGVCLIGSAYTVVGAYPQTVEWINPFAGGVGVPAVSMDATHPAAWGPGSHADFYITYRKA